MRRPFTNDLGHCAKCTSLRRFVVEYNDGGVRRFDGTVAWSEYLIVRCLTCGYEYEMDCADAVPSEPEPRPF